MFWQPAPAKAPTTARQPAGSQNEWQRRRDLASDMLAFVFMSRPQHEISVHLLTCCPCACCVRVCICTCVCVLRLRMFVLCAAAATANCIFTLPFALFTWKLYWLWDWPLTLPEPRASCHGWHAHGAAWQRLVSGHRKVATSGSHV